MAIPKYLRWSIWLCLNQAIFVVDCVPESTTIKGMMLLFEVISSRGFDDLDVNELTYNEKEWLQFQFPSSKFKISCRPSLLYKTDQGGFC